MLPEILSKEQSKSSYIQFGHMNIIFLSKLLLKIFMVFSLVHFSTCAYLYDKNNSISERETSVNAIRGFTKKFCDCVFRAIFYACCLKEK